LKRLDEINMTQKELAFLLKVSPQQVSKWVKGNENLTLETISKLEVALNIDLLYVAGFEEKQAPTEKAPAIRPSRKASNELKETTK
jgi:transcriptional regulator with XRE-family HTH domain